MLTKEKLIEICEGQNMPNEAIFNLEKLSSFIEEYADHKEEQKLDEKVKWLQVHKNQELVIRYFVSKEIAKYIRATHAHISPDFYLLPSGDWVRLVEDKECTLIEWCEKSIKEYDAISESQKGALGSYYLGKASGINEVKLLLQNKQQ